MEKDTDPYSLRQCTINNLKVEMTDEKRMAGLIRCQVYNSKNVTINNYTERS